MIKLKMLKENILIKLYKKKKIFYNTKIYKTQLYLFVTLIEENNKSN